MRFPLVSIITPTYRHAALIGRGIESVLAQTYPNWEMLIMDDGSPDNTAEIVTGYRDPRIRYFPCPHRGLTGLQDLYNHALSNSKGEFVAILEGDDFWPEGKLETSLAAFDSPDIVVVYGLTQITDVGGRKREVFIPQPKTLECFPRSVLCNNPPGTAARGILLSHSLWTCAVSSVIRRQALDAVGGFLSIKNGSLIDRPTFLALSLAGRFRFINRVMGYWLQHDHNTSANIGAWETMAEGILHFVVDFMEKNAGQLGMSVQERLNVKRYWERNVTVSRLGYGRALLLEKQCPQARGEFLRVLEFLHEPRHMFLAGIGWLASWLRADIEGLYRVAGKSYGMRQFNHRD